MTNLSEVKINALAEKYSSPLFVVSADSIKNNLQTFKARFSDKYPKVVIAYSYKVNYLPGILDVIHKQGAWAEVASGFEYDIARELNVPGNSIVFNGPYKKKEELEKAINEGALINVDH
ncbi:MAG: diaminopimelate decarboxylase, partial [Thermodesulfobacteriota bacterium]